MKYLRQTAKLGKKPNLGDLRRSTDMPTHTKLREECWAGEIEKEIEEE